MTVPTLAIDDLSIQYRTEAGILDAVRNVTLSIDPRESFGLVGESGSGKTTLALGAIRYLAANGRISGGSVRLRGESLTDMAVADLCNVWGKRIGMVYQNPGSALNPSLTVGRQIAEAAMIHQALSKTAALDRAREQARGKAAIGTTGRGIGPAYEDKVARRGLRLADLFHRERLAAKLGELLDWHNFMLQRYFGAEPSDFQQVLEECLAFAERLRPLVGDVGALLAEKRAAGEHLLFEGAQGTLLDIDHGTYPFVTSSNTTAGAAATGTGIGPRELDYILGITKAYTTRVGAGPFPTELEDDVGRHLAERGHEFGSTTGRPRRCGWFDAVGLRRAVQINSISGLCITKLDVLDELDTLRIATGYRTGDAAWDSLPAGAEAVAECVPEYVEMPGWKCSTVGMRRLQDLPSAARDYLASIEELTGVPVDIISTGPERSETIVLRHPFES